MDSFRVDTTVLNNIINKLPGNTEDWIRKTALYVEGEAKTRAPVDTGNLKNSIQAERKGDALWWVSDGVEYGIYQELGTYKMAAQPFMIPAVARAENFMLQKARELIE